MTRIDKGLLDELIEKRLPYLPSTSRQDERYGAFALRDALLARLDEPIECPNPAAHHPGVWWPHCPWCGTRIQEDGK